MFKIIKNIDIVFYLKNEFVNTIYVSLISLMFKMIIIKLVLYKTFKINNSKKKMMINSYENKIEKDEIENCDKRNNYLFFYHMKIIIYFCLLIILSLFFSYICISFGGVFPNSINAFFFGLLFSYVLSFVICAIICLFIVAFNKISKAFKNKCLLSTFVVLCTIY